LISAAGPDRSATSFPALNLPVHFDLSTDDTAGETFQERFTINRNLNLAQFDDVCDTPVVCRGTAVI